MKQDQFQFDPKVVLDKPLMLHLATTCEEAPLFGSSKKKIRFGCLAFIMEVVGDLLLPIGTHN